MIEVYFSHCDSPSPYMSNLYQWDGFAPCDHSGIKRPSFLLLYCSTECCPHLFGGSWVTMTSLFQPVRKGTGRRQRTKSNFLLASDTVFHKSLMVMPHWKELGHITNPSCRGCWEMQSGQPHAQIKLQGCSFTKTKKGRMNTGGHSQYNWKLQCKELNKEILEILFSSVLCLLCVCLSCLILSQSIFCCYTKIPQTG